MFDAHSRRMYTWWYGLTGPLPRSSCDSHLKRLSSYGSAGPSRPSLTECSAFEDFAQLAKGSCGNTLPLHEADRRSHAVKLRPSERLTPCFGLVRHEVLAQALGDRSRQVASRVD